MPVIDADAHVIETTRTWEFMDSAWRQYTPRLVSGSNAAGAADEFWLIGRQAFPRQSQDISRSGTSTATREVQDIEARLRHMDALGVDVHVLYPTLFLRPLTDSPEMELALDTCYNRWLADIWARGQGRLRWAAVLPYMTIDKALEELRWACDHGACAVLIRAFEGTRQLSDPYFYPVYAEARRLNVPMCVHVGSGSPVLNELLTADGTTFSRGKLGAVGAFHNLVERETPKRFPSLRWGIIEASASWLPFVCQDLRNRGERMHGGTWDTDRHILRDNNIYIACQTDDDLPYLIKYSGEDNLVIGSDYGHADTAAELEALRRLQQAGTVPARVAQKIVEHNPRALYGM